MIKDDLCPAIGCMAKPTIHPKIPLVGIIAGVAGKAGLRRALKIAVQVAFLARHGQMRPCQLKSCPGMVENDLRPAIRYMANLAIYAKVTLMGIIQVMTVNTRLRCTLENVVRVTFLARHIQMRPN